MDNVSKYPKIRIESRGGFGYNTYIDGIEIPKVIETKIDLNSCPKKATVEFYVDVEPIEFEGIITKRMFTWYNGKKYELKKVED
jgi:hypothetical protein